MANRAMLYLNRSGDPNYEYSEYSDVLVAASYCIPVLWCSVFAPEDIVWCHVRFDSDEREEDIDYEMIFPGLLTSLPRVRERAIAHRSYFSQFFPDHLNELYDQWLQLLHEEDAPYLQVDTQDIWAMYGDTQQFATKLNTFVRAFEHRDLADLRELLREVNIQLDPVTKQITFDENSVKYYLRGYKWVRAVSWGDG
jgi:hypothetical protein